MSTTRDKKTSAPAATSFFTATTLPSHHTTMFSFPASSQTQKRYQDILSPLLAGLTGDVISAFLELNDKVKLLRLNKDLEKRLGANALLKQALIKQLLFTLVTAFQNPRPYYHPQHEGSLLKGTLHLTELYPVEKRLALAASGRLAETKKEPDEAFNQAFQERHKQTLAKDISLQLIRAHQYPKAEALLNDFPPFLKNNEDRLDYLFALMVSGYQNEAEAWIKQYPELVMEKGSVIDRDGKVYQGLTPYQYTLCLRHTQMRLMIRKTLSEKEAALQAEQFKAGKNQDMQALKLKYYILMERTQSAYLFYCTYFTSWSLHQARDYWSRVIGGLQREWPVHWMQELFYPHRAFNSDTCFHSEEALKSLPEAKYETGLAFYPCNTGYHGVKLFLKRYPSGVQISKEWLIEDRLSIEGVEAKYLTATLFLIEQGEEYFIYGPRLNLTGDIEAAVQWKLSKLDVSLSAEALKTLDFTKVELDGSVVDYSPTLKPIYAAADKSLGGRVAGVGISFDCANIKIGDNQSAICFGNDIQSIYKNLTGLKLLDAVRSRELQSELNTVKQHLPKKEGETVSGYPSPSSFR